MYNITAALYEVFQRGTNLSPCLPLLLPPLSSHYCIDAVTSLGGDVTGSVELEHPCQRQGDNRAILTASKREKSGRPSKQLNGHLPSWVPAGKAGQRWVRGCKARPSAVTSALPRLHGEERLLAGAVPDLEETGAGESSYGAG